MGQVSGIAVSCDASCRRGWDPTLLWLWHRPGATAPIRPLAWEPPYAVEAALEKAKRPKKKVIRNRMEEITTRNHLNKPVYRSKRKKKHYKSNDKHKKEQKDKHEDILKRTSKS